MSDPYYVANLEMVFVDTETSGIDANRNGLLQVAGIRTSPNAKYVIRSYCSKIRLADGLQLDQEAVRINKYTPEAWSDAPSEAEVLPEFYEILRGAVWIGHCPVFDRGFVEAALRRARQRIPLGWRYPIDTAAMAFPLVKAGLCSSVKLSAVCEALKIPQAAAHDALDDARSCLAVYQAIMARFSGSVTPEGPTLLEANK